MRHLVKGFGFPKAVRRWAVVVVTTPPYNTPLNVDHGRTTRVEMLQGIKLWHLYPPAVSPEEELKVRAVDNVSFRLVPSTAKTGGEHLFFPCGWQHAVETSGKEVAVLLNCCAIEPHNVDLILSTQISAATPPLVLDAIVQSAVGGQQQHCPPDETKSSSAALLPSTHGCKRKRPPVPKSNHRASGRKLRKKKRSRLSNARHLGKSCEALLHPSHLPSSGRHVRLIRVGARLLCNSCYRASDARIPNPSHD